MAAKCNPPASIPTRSTRSSNDDNARPFVDVEAITTPRAEATPKPKKLANTHNRLSDGESNDSNGSNGDDDDDDDSVEGVAYKKPKVAPQYTALLYSIDTNSNGAAPGEDTEGIVPVKQTRPQPRPRAHQAILPASTEALESTAVTTRRRAPPRNAKAAATPASTDGQENITGAETIPQRCKAPACKPQAVRQEPPEIFTNVEEVPQAVTHKVLLQGRGGAAKLSAVISKGAPEAMQKEPPCEGKGKRMPPDSEIPNETPNNKKRKAPMPEHTAPHTSASLDEDGCKGAKLFQTPTNKHKRNYPDMPTSERAGRGPKPSARKKYTIDIQEQAMKTKATTKINAPKRIVLTEEGFLRGC
ncbi:hypothetical protein BOTBODRAFT_181840 [Botryobasidium botryosum FD-172 SS1]|uniref:Uncharacterized protein n=1 Tax=Botryobasidium botryosum (strain FD-172 SS1) TaxID=930990 RepID=A0A067M3L0_BOTB1|nr:hypothetical protein BOTBODRAFT_181840 [Botryobasidium botryosum FD-172 SS1]